MLTVGCDATIPLATGAKILKSEEKVKTKVKEKRWKRDEKIRCTNRSSGADHGTSHIGPSVFVVPVFA